jgi:F-type H+-transporting ATPase subunit epsilon
MADKKIEVRLLTPTVRSALSQYKYQGEADMVIVRALGDEKDMGGDMGFLHGHTPCSVVLDAGVLRIILGEGQEPGELRLAVLGGVCQVEDNIVTIITENAEWPEDIDRNRAQTRRDDILDRLAKADPIEPEEQDALRQELRNVETLIMVSNLPPSGLTKDKG